MLPNIRHIRTMVIGDRLIHRPGSCCLDPAYYSLPARPARAYADWMDVFGLSHKNQFAVQGPILIFGIPVLPVAGAPIRRTCTSVLLLCQSDLRGLRLYDAVPDGIAEGISESGTACATSSLPPCYPPEHH